MCRLNFYNSKFVMQPTSKKHRKLSFAVLFVEKYGLLSSARGVQLVHSLFHGGKALHEHLGRCCKVEAYALRIAEVGAVV